MVPDMKTRCFQYLPPADVHDTCRVMLAIASPSPHRANDQPWTVLPFVGSSFPPCGFCGLFARALNIATGMHVKLAPIHRSNFFHQWSFPSFSGLAPLMHDASQAQVMELMCQDLQRVIKEEWSLAYFLFNVSSPRLSLDAESHSDSEEEDDFSGRSSDNESSDGDITDRVGCNLVLS
ncbi:hypothetical protein DL93DRAFT_354815 [Clavulina sp. PMI_390]|nr:hypothetical protein DL93DRAFT_354815 [Clavulina sp. PMI_390]